MKTNSTALILSLATLGISALAHATDTNSFSPRGARSQGALLTPSASLLDAGSWDLALTLMNEGGVLRPEVATGEVRGDNQFERIRWLDNRQSAHLQIAVTPSARVELFAALPVLIHYNTNAGRQTAAPPDSTAGIGDMRLGARVGLLQPTADGVAWALQGALIAPTGDDELLYGQKRARVEIGTSVGYVSRSNWRVDGWAGFRGAELFVLGDQVLGDAFSVSAAFQQRFGDLVWFGEAGMQNVISAVPPNAAVKRTSLSVDAGVRYFFESFYIDGGLGFAPLDHSETPQWRAMASIGTVGSFGGRGGRGGGSYQAGDDIDGDGIPNHLDQCPTQAEDFDGFEDEDGCPDWDNDGDGIPDTHDLCPNDPEDFDGIADHDGCPETDADGDGIPDEVDACPEAAEDFDGFEDEDGCPEPGSRDPAAQWRAQSMNELTTWFDTNSSELTPQAENTVRTAVLIMMRNQGDVTIKGHADDRGSDELNRDLSLRRAEAVKRALVDAGVDERRLHIEARGPEEPISPKTDFGRSMNRRVTFDWR